MIHKNRNNHFDLIIIGAGSAGLSVASGAAQLGLKVVLFEANKMGGDCLNSGCIPSKALLSYAKRHQQLLSAAAEVGVTFPNDKELHWKRAMAHVKNAIKTIAPHDSQERFESLGVKVVRAFARLTGPKSVEANGETFSAKIIVVATGAKAYVPPISGLDEIAYDTNESLFTREEMPDKLVVVGGGALGCEMAQAHAHLGCDVTLVESGCLMPNDDREAVEIVRKKLVADGVMLLENHRFEGIKPLSNYKKVFVVHCMNANGKRIEIQGTDLLFAIGRKPNIAKLGLETVGVTTNSQGIAVDHQLRSNVKSIYALGDAAGGGFTHTASAHAAAFVRGALFRAAVDISKIKVPRVTYCDPELAQLGMTEDSAQKAGLLTQVLRVDLNTLDRQITDADSTGFAKIILGKNRDLLGVTIVGKGAGDLLGPWLVKEAGRIDLSVIASTIFPYPTRSEVTKRLAGMAFVDRLFARSTQRLVRFLFDLPRL